MIRYEHVSVRYPRADRDALDGVSFDVPRGRLTAIVGPNGSGKSTLIRALLGRVATSGGRILVDDADVSTLGRRDLARRIAVVAQREEPAFPLPVREYIALGRFPHSGAWGSDTRRDADAIDAAVERAEVGAFASRTTDALSGGEWQRVRIARALAQDTPALVLDEPSTYLDVAHEMATFELLDSLARSGHAVLIVSHQLNLVARFADHMVLLGRGIVAAAGTPADVMHGPVLERVYEWPLVVTRDPAVGAPALLPLRARRTP